MFIPLETKSGPPLGKMFLTGFKRKTLIVVAAILILLSGGVFLFGKAYVVPILMYHSINPVSDSTMKALIVSPQKLGRAG